MTMSRLPSHLLLSFLMIAVCVTTMFVDGLPQLIDKDKQEHLIGSPKTHSDNGQRELLNHHQDGQEKSSFAVGNQETKLNGIQFSDTFEDERREQPHFEFLKTHSDTVPKDGQQKTSLDAGNQENQRNIGEISATFQDEVEQEVHSAEMRCDPGTFDRCASPERLGWNFATGYANKMAADLRWLKDGKELLRHGQERLSGGAGGSEVLPVRKGNSFLLNFANIVKSFEDKSVFFLPLPPRVRNQTDDISHEDSEDYYDEYESNNNNYLRNYDLEESLEETADETVDETPSDESPDVSSQCIEDVKAIIKSFFVAPSSWDDLWNLKLMDSWGKSKDGLMTGNYAVGYFKECLDVSAVRGDDVNFDGQYCFVYTKKIQNSSDFQGLVPPHYGTCIPSSCSDTELKDALNTQLLEFGYSVPRVECQKRDEPLATGPYVVAGCIVIGVMVALVIIGTLAHLIMKENTAPILKAFSASENMKKILHIKLNDPREISCFHGIRVMSICWVLIGHQYSYQSDVASNELEGFDLINQWMFQSIWAGFRAVDTFFIIGGLLLAKGLLASDFCVTSDPDPAKQTRNDGFIDRQLVRSVQEQGTVKTITRFVSNYLFFIFHRVVRMVPAMLLVLMMCVGPSEWMVNGPFFRNYQKDYLPECRKNWWMDLTFVANLFDKATCAPQSWYLGVDFQLYLVAPFLLLPMKFFSHKLTYLSLLTLISCLIPGLIVVIGGYMPAPLFSLSPAQWDYFPDIYMMPWCRASPFLVGAFCAVLLERCNKLDKESSKWWKFISNKFVLAAGWLVFTAVALTVVFCLAEVNQLTLNLEVPHFSSKFLDFLYAAFIIALWAACVGWLVVVCAIGLGGPVNTFLSHPMWQPLSRVTFSVFLIHLPIQIWMFYSAKQNLYITHISVFLSCGGLILFSYISAFALSLVAEAPYINLLKIINKK